MDLLSSTATQRGNLPQWLADVDWDQVAALKILSTAMARGVLSGSHRSPHYGDGIEFAGHRPYVPGDDLRWIDRRALLRHDKLIVRQFETERNRTVLIVVDATASMGFRSRDVKHDKLRFASILAATLARVVLTQGDRVGLSWLGGTHELVLPPSARKDMFDRCVVALTAQRAAGDAMLNPASIANSVAMARNLEADMTVLLSDLVDLPHAPSTYVANLSGRRRCMTVVQVLDPQEEAFPFHGSVRLRSLEGSTLVETVGEAVRAGYLQAMQRLRARWNDATHHAGGQFTSCVTDQDPVAVLRSVLEAVGGRSC